MRFRNPWPVLIAGLLLLSAYAAYVNWSTPHWRAEWYQLGYQDGLSVTPPPAPVKPVAVVQFESCGRVLGWMLVRSDGSAAYGSWQTQPEEQEQAMTAIANMADQTGGLTDLQFDCPI